ncbi:uncharacterized protein PG986_005214 [Apiospora aurea]|uniref:Uncharacterized protein n=1 Tax=Apiospora aurea TaxID=335848 RepID=A0ABR1QHQ5_9PEZI
MNAIEMSAKSTGNSNKTLTLRHRDNLLWAVSLVHFNNTAGYERQVMRPDAPVVAQEFGLYWRVNQYRSSVTNNTYSESVEEVPAPSVRDAWDHNGAWPDESLKFHDFAIFEQPGTGFPGRMQLCPGNNHADPDHDCFSASASTVWSVNHHFRNLFTANITADDASVGLGPGRLENDAHIFAGIVEPDGFKGLWNWGKQDLDETFRALAYSMSNAVRASRPDHGSDRGPAMAVGRVAAIYEMQWAWMSLHCATLLLGAAFLYLTIARTGETAAPAFNSHSLAILANGSHLFESVAGAERGGEIGKWARENQAKIGKEPKSRQRIEIPGEANYEQVERRPRSPGLDESGTGLVRGGQRLVLLVFPFTSNGRANVIHGPGHDWDAQCSKVTAKLESYSRSV